MSGDNVSTNDVTGDALRSRPNSKDYEQNYDRIFREQPKDDSQEETEKQSPCSADA